MNGPYDRYESRSPKYDKLKTAFKFETLGHTDLVLFVCWA